MLTPERPGEQQQSDDHGNQPGDENPLGPPGGHKPGGDPHGEHGHHDGLWQKRKPRVDGVVPEGLLQVQRPEEEHSVHAGGHDRAYGAGTDEAAQPQDPYRNERVRRA